MPYVSDCLDFLATKQDIYLQEQLMEFEDLLRSTDTSRPADWKTCPGPTFLYHTYWNGVMTWRVELFIKSFLQTQNFRCSRLWLWVDQNYNPDAVVDLVMSPRFRKFLPLADDEIIIVKAWKVPERIPLPTGLDHKDGKGFGRKSPTRLSNMRKIGDRIYQDECGQQWLDFHRDGQQPLGPVTLSDIFRFAVLHLHGGLYLDMDVLLQRDMRPLLLPRQSFAERWGAREGDGDFNTAVLYLMANSSLSSYFLRIGARLGHSFHPLILGDIARKDGRHKDILMFETALFDPVWTEFDGARKGRCTVPCFKNFEDFFLSNVGGEQDASQPSVPVVARFFDGAFAYHIHNLVSGLKQTP
jgi:hypothetical protein